MVALVGARPPISTVCWFNSPEEAAAFRETHSDYTEDVIVFCPRCGLFHLSHPSWLASRPWEIPVERIDFATMTPVQPEAELLEGFVRIILPSGKCFDIREELWTEAREIEPKCVIISRKATGKDRN